MDQSMRNIDLRIPNFASCLAMPFPENETEVLLISSSEIGGFAQSVF
jgi:hypothetical protein